MNEVGFINLICFFLLMITFNYFNILKIEPNSDNVQKLEYLDMFIKEVLRMYPIANPYNIFFFNFFTRIFILFWKLQRVINRRCTQATIIKGIEIPVDLNIAVDVLSIHYDPELWGPEDPNKFYPLRFFFYFYL